MDVFHRLERLDAFYAAPVAPILSGGIGVAGRMKLVLEADAVRRISPTLEFRAAAAYAQAGRPLRTAGGRDLTYDLLQLDFRC